MKFTMPDSLQSCLVNWLRYRKAALCKEPQDESMCQLATEMLILAQEGVQVVHIEFLDSRDDGK